MAFYGELWFWAFIIGIILFIIGVIFYDYDRNKNETETPFWVWALIDNIVKPDSFYRDYPKI